MSTPTTSPALQSQPPAFTPRPTNGLAIATLVLGICGFAILPVILGHIALKQIRERGDGGAGLAIAGLILGYLAVIGWLIVGVLTVAAITAGITFGAR